VQAFHPQQPSTNHQVGLNFRYTQNSLAEPINRC
jgi:hypothetical protein